MGGVLELVTAAPGAGRRYRLGASLLALGRHGTARLADEIVDRDRPEYSDLLGRFEGSASERQTLRLHALAGRDRLDLAEAGEEPKRIDTAYDSAYLWLTHQLVVGPRAFADTALSASRQERDRRADERDDEKEIRVDDRRRSRVLELQQNWHLQLGAGHLLELGAGARRFATDYDYFSERRFDTPLAALRAEPKEGEWSFRGRLEDEPYGLFAVDRWQPTDELSLEVGLRYDDHPLADDRVWSPRVQLALARGASIVRAAWGHYHQSQRSYELAVVDGESAIHPLERAEHRVLGWERRFDAGPLAALRVELYRRAVRDPRPRYESLLEPFDAFPEGEVDRYRFAPESSRARGAELFARGRDGERFGWWVNYAWAESEDVIDGARVPRLVDQRHAVNASWRVALPRDWTLDLVWVFHTGRPTTAVTVVEVPGDEGEDGDDGEEGDDDEDLAPGRAAAESTFVPVRGPLNAERLDDYHRLDLRISREWRLARGRLTFYADAQNLYDRENAAGFSIELDEETGELRRDPELWPGFFASAGVSWEF
jgi:outer membrane receptor protein involved in Fe transport